MPFSINLLNNFDQLKSFLNCDQEIKLISKSASDKKPYSPHLYFNKLQVCWIRFKRPFDKRLAQLFERLSVFFESKGHPTVGRFFYILSKQQLRMQRHLKAQEIWGTDFLVPSMNVHQTTTWDFYKNRSLKVNTLQDPQIKQLALVDCPLNFYNPEGLCRGMSTLFAHLYLQTSSLYQNDPYRHFIAVAKLFEKGANQKAALLQTLNNRHVAQKIWNRKVTLITSSNVNHFAPGVYSIMFSHNLLYIKVSNEIGFVYDPTAENSALSLSGKDHAETLKKMYKIISPDYADHVAYTQIV